MARIPDRPRITSDDSLKPYGFKSLGHTAQIAHSVVNNCDHTTVLCQMVNHTGSRSILPGVHSPRLPQLIELKRQDAPAPASEGPRFWKSLLQHAFGRQHLACQTLLPHGGLVEGFSQRLENGFHNMVWIATIHQIHMQIEPAVSHKSLKEI